MGLAQCQCGHMGMKEMSVGTHQASVMRLDRAGTRPLCRSLRGATVAPRVFMSGDRWAQTSVLAPYVGKLMVLLLFGLEGGHAFCVKQRCERLRSCCVCAWHYASACHSPKTPKELVPARELTASLPASSLAVRPGRLCFDIFLNSPLHVSCFYGSSPSAVFFLCLFGLPDVAATGYFGSYLGITRSGGKKKDNGKILYWKKEFPYVSPR